jgi:hypothetical protein
MSNSVKGLGRKFDLANLLIAKTRPRESTADIDSSGWITWLGVYGNRERRLGRLISDAEKFLISQAIASVTEDVSRCFRAGI